MFVGIIAALLLSVVIAEYIAEIQEAVDAKKRDRIAVSAYLNRTKDIA